MTNPNHLGTNAREFHLDIAQESAATSPPDLLATASGLTKREIKDAMGKGAVWLTRAANSRRLRRHKAALRAGDALHFYYDPEVLAQRPPEPRLLADEGDYSVWYKPFGLRSQGSKWGDHTTLERWAELHLQPQRSAFTVHRLDRAASGLMLLAHGKQSARRLSELFAQRRVIKHYQTIVHADDGALPPELAQEMELRIDQPLDGQEAVSVLRLIRRPTDARLALLDVRIETGRKHQIRRHLADMGLPVVGDRAYGRAGDSADLALCAVALAFSWQAPDQDRPSPRLYQLDEDLRPLLQDRVQ